MAVGLAIGLALSNAVGFPGGWPLAAGLLVCVASLLIQRDGLGPLAAFLLVMAAMVSGLIFGTERIGSIDRGAMLGEEGSEVSLTGFVSAPPRQSTDGQRFLIETDRGRALVETARLPAGTSTGDRVAVTGSLGTPPDWLGGYLDVQGVARVVEADSVEYLPGQRPGLAGWLDGIRSRAEDALDFGIGQREAALARGFVLGQDQAIEEGVADQFRASGLAHLLAVSGQNILLLSILATPLLAALGIPLRARLLVVVVLIALYVPITGAGPSIQRAGIMGVAAIAATAAGRPAMRSWILALAAALTLGLNPRALFDPGWQLSFAAVAGIMVFARPIADAVVGVLPGRHSRVSSALADGVAVTAAAAIATLPLIAFHFESVPITTLGANLLAMPAVAPSMWLGMISASLGQVHEFAALPFNQVNAVLLAFIAWVASVAGGEGSTVALSRPAPEWLAVGAVVSFAALGILIRYPRLLVTLLAAAVLLPGVLILQGGRRGLAEPPEGGVRIEMLDIGQGDAFLIRSSSGRSILVDTGPPGGGVGDAVASAGLEKLDAVLLTHLDLDHIGGFGEVLERFRVETVFFEEQDPAVRSAILAEGSTSRQLSAGDRIDLDPASLTVLSPPPGSPRSIDRNARSLVVLVEALGRKILLTADAESESVPIRPGRLDVLKLAHHGSRDEGIEELLAMTLPRVALISAGRENRYGHPDSSTLRALSEASIPIYRTDRDGTVSVVISTRGMAIEKGR